MTIRPVISKSFLPQTREVLRCSPQIPFLGGNEAEQKCKIKKRERLCNFFSISCLVTYFQKKQNWFAISCLFMTLKMSKVKQESQSLSYWKGVTHLHN